MSKGGADAQRHRDQQRTDFEIEGKDVAPAAVDDFKQSTVDFADCLLGRRSRAAGASETVTFDRALRGLEGFRVL